MQNIDVIKPPDQPTTPKKVNSIRTILKDIHEAIYGDGWMFICIWGKPGSGKTNLAMQLAQAHYKDYDKTLGCIVFQINQFIHNLKYQLPCSEETTTVIKHRRVPVTIWDDIGAHGNKASKRDDKEFDIFKGAIDTLRTKAAVVIITCNHPSALTEQIRSKITHEIVLQGKVENFIGKAKYDVARWLPDYYGHRSIIRKSYRSKFKFDVRKVPVEKYTEYNALRENLVDELFQSMLDKAEETSLNRIVSKMTEEDFELLHYIFIARQKGDLGIPRKRFYDTYKEYQPNLLKATTRSLVVSVRKQGTDQYYYQLTDFGIMAFNAYDKLRH